MLVFVTAELGTNWRGDFDILERMVDFCSEVGIDAVKFQCLNQMLLARHIELDYYRKASLNEDNVARIEEICASNKMEWYASVTYGIATKMLLDHNVRLFKIRVADNAESDIIDACCTSAMDAGKDAKVIVSSTRPLKQSIYDRYPEVDIVNLYCIPRYPTPWGEINFNMLKNPEFEGYSNHCPNPLAVLKAARMGAKYIEFHLTENRDNFALDNPVSIPYSQAREMMKWLRKL